VSTGLRRGDILALLFAAPSRAASEDSARADAETDGTGGDR
jgi:hypothetical protein